MLSNINIQGLTSEFTFAELYEDAHNRLDLRNVISNSLMAICLYEVNSSSHNLPKYIEDGLTLSYTTLLALDNISKGIEPNGREYVIRVVKDLLTNKGKIPFLENKYRQYKARFEGINKIFSKMRNEDNITKKESNNIKEFLIGF
ncbi:unnamed protein product, partial [marine sediment metagenome]